jgi:hypothetical protein
MGRWALNRSLVWAVLYLALIPIFAGIYTAINHGFFSSSIRLEQSYSDVSADLLNILCSIVVSKSGEQGNISAKDGSYYGQGVHYGAKKDGFGILVFRPRPESEQDIKSDIECGESLSAKENQRCSIFNICKF